MSIANSTTRSLQFFATVIALALLTISAHAQIDSDGDGLDDEREMELGTNPNLADTDRDRINDGLEVDNGLDPLDPRDAQLDPDGDGLVTVDELLDFDTDPNDADTDNDTATDGEEVYLGTSPTNPAEGGNGACRLISVASATLRDMSIVSLNGPRNEGYPLLIIGETNCPPATTSVSASIDNVALLSLLESPFVSRATLNGTGDRALTLSAQGGIASVTDTTDFVLQDAATADTDQNGLPDNPFEIPAINGDVWLSLLRHDDVAQSVAATRWRNIVRNPLDPSPSITLALEHPDPVRGNATVVVDLPRDLVEDGEVGVLMLQIARIPAVMIAGSTLIPGRPSGTTASESTFLEITILVRAANETTFRALPAERLANRPLTLSIHRLDLQGDAALYRFPTRTDLADQGRLNLRPVTGGAWTSTGATLNAADTALTVEQSELSLFGIFNTGAIIAEGNGEGDGEGNNTGCAASPPGHNSDSAAVLTYAAVLAVLFATGFRKRSA